MTAWRPGPAQTQAVGGGASWGGLSGLSSRPTTAIKPPVGRGALTGGTSAPAAAAAAEATAAPGGSGSGGDGGGTSRYHGAQEAPQILVL